MTYEAWRISYQNSEQAARAAYELAMMNQSDARRMDWLEVVGFTTRSPAKEYPVMNVHCWFGNGKWMWTAQYIGSEFPTARHAIDAAIAGAKP